MIFAGGILIAALIILIGEISNRRRIRKEWAAHERLMREIWRHQEEGK